MNREEMRLKLQSASDKLKEVLTDLRSIRRLITI